MLVNWLVALFAAKRNKGIAEFCEYWNTESYNVKELDVVP